MKRPRSIPVALPLALALAFAVATTPAYANSAVTRLAAYAADNAADSAVDDGARALSSQSFPWYDETNDALQPVDQPAPRRDWRLPNWNLPIGPVFGQLLQYAFVALLVGVLAVIVYLLVKAYLNREKEETESQGGQVQVIDDQARIEQLPFNVREPTGDLLALARQHYDRGDFNEAIVYLYSYMLLHLDRHQIIRLSKGKTNRQYLREVADRGPLSELLERTMVSFEEAFFGRHHLDRAAFEACWSQLDRFHDKVTEASA